MGGLVSIDFFVVPAARFAVLFVFIGGPGGFMGHTCRDLGPEPMLKEELADTRIYLESLARALNLDLDRACEAKMPVLRKRWPEPPTEAQT